MYIYIYIYTHHLPRLRAAHLKTTGYEVWGVGFEVWGVGCGVWGVGCGDEWGEDELRPERSLHIRAPPCFADYS